jgi:hypothetical protein
MKGPEFLRKTYNLQGTPEVQSAVRRKEVREKTPHSKDRLKMIQTYLDRFKEITDSPDPEKKERGLHILKQKMHEFFVIKPEEIPEAVFLLEQRIARERGHGDVEITEEFRRQKTQEVITNQRQSLDAWVDYLSSSDAMYPDYLKYFAFRSILKMGAYDKEKKEFTKRTIETVKPFPDINREALAYVLDAIEKRYGVENVSSPLNKDFGGLLEDANFAKLYAFAIDKLTPATGEQLENTKGKWVKYVQGSDHMPLVNSLQGHGTGWCTAGESTAQKQLAAGDFHIYYSEDSEGNPNIPRVAIRMEGDKIAEVRGIAEQQNLDPYIGSIVEEKIKEFPDGKQYEKKSSDMKLLTEIENKTKRGEELNRDELVFLYEIEREVEGFGYEIDPRIYELRSQRDQKKDLKNILGVDKYTGLLNLRGFRSTEGVTFPPVVEGDVVLSYLDISNVTLPKLIKGDLNLIACKNLESVSLPGTVTGRVGVSSSVQREFLRTKYPNLVFSAIRR